MCKEVKKTFKDRILEALSGGDDKKVDKFVVELSKYLKKQVQGVEDKVEDLMSEIEDIDLLITEAFEKVNMEEIGNTSSRKDYVVKYVKNLDNLFNDKRRKELQIEEQKVVLGWRKKQLSIINE